MTGARRFAVAAWLVLLAAGAGVIVQSRFVADLSSFLPASPAPEQRILVEQLRTGTVARLMLVGIEGGDARSRAALSRGLADRLRADPAFESVANGATGTFERDRQVLFANRYALSARVTPQRFETAGLRAAIEETLDLLASPAGLLVKDLVARDPTGETLAVANDLQREDGPALENGVWSSKGRALLVVLPRAGAADVDAQARAAERVQALFDAVVAASDAKAPAAHLELSGAGVFSARSRAMIEHDVVRLTTASALIVAILLLAVYRSGRVLALGLVPVVTGAVAGIAAVSLGFGVVHGITLGFGTTLIGEAVDYAIYLFVQSESADAAREAAWLARFWPAIRLGVLTSIAGFCAMLFSGLPGLAQLGLYSIVGLAAAACVTRFVLPALLPARFRTRDLSAIGERLDRAAANAARARIVFAALVVLAAIVLVGKRDTLWDSDIASLNPITTRDRAIDAELRAGLGAADARYLVTISAPDVESVLMRTELVGKRLDALVAAGRLGGYDSPARILPSAATQKARLASLPEAAVLRTRLREALAGLPIRAEKLEPFVEDVRVARSARPVTHAELEGTAAGAALAGMLQRGADGAWTALVSLRPGAANAIDATALREAIREASVPGTAFVDLKGEVDRLYRGYFDRALAASAAGFAAIVVLLFVFLRDPRRVWRVLLPLAAGVLVVAAGLALLGVRLTLMHLVGLLLVAAVGSNYAIFFDRLAPGEDARRTLASLALANATTVASFGVLALSSIPVLHAIGSTVAAGALVTLGFTAAFARRYNRPGEPT